MKHLLSISLCLLFAIGMFAEEVTVSGTVLDAQTSEPLIGVSVVVKGTTNGIVTDFDGNFTLKVETNSVLALSYVGYDDKEITVSKAGNLGVINMTAGAIGLEDVMITNFTFLSTTMRDDYRSVGCNQQNAGRSKSNHWS